MDDLCGALNLRQLQPRARAALVSRGALPAYDYVAGGANDETSLADSECSFSRWLLRPRMFVDTTHVDLSTSLLGQRVRTPLLVAPMAMQRLMHPDGELAVVRAAASLGVGYCLSTLSTTSMEEVAAAARGVQSAGDTSWPPPPLWFQLYVLKDRALTASLVRRAEAAGFTGLVVTADAPRLGRREADTANGFSLPAALSLANFKHHFEGASFAGTPEASSGLFSWFASLVDPSLTWDDIAWLRSLTRLPIIVKGILTAEDAATAASLPCVAAVAVSSHGGRQLDGVAAPIDALPEVVAAVAGAGAPRAERGTTQGGRLPVLVDGGFRRGTDVLKALALGADAVMIGRPALWALAVGGEGSVRSALSLLINELSLAMSLAGCAALPPPRALVMRRAAL